MLRAELQEEEFQEADILWPDAADLEELLPRAYFSHIGIDDDDDGSGEYSGDHQPRKVSSPIDIPAGRKAVGARGPQVPGRYSKFGASHAGVGAASVVVGSHVFVPPQVIVDQRAKRDKAMIMLVGPSRRAARARKMRE
ncbi:hypothetical protein C2845_PM08G24320 [Panicum miliaceum]|uniref:Uncharacterized protein n=1 Tax=Panicum miliaceum TaxID=4540 RepID=A0A3L6QX41_PANMI|nr:hypothetical protein C2845_PM08G24320 [Panicum miliaceum]